MKPILCAGLRRDVLTLMPVRLVNARNEHLAASAGAGLKILELSNTDQVFDDYTSVTLFYDVHGQQLGSEGMFTHECSSANIASILLAALEELLAHFPAAAGRLHFNETEGRLEVHYTSSAPPPSSCATAHNFGVQFVAAQADIAFSELGDVSAPHSSLDLLLPTLIKDTSQGLTKNRRPYPLVAIQVTAFTCGGFTLAFMSNHAFLDGNGAALFLKNLCSIARGDGIVCPFETSSRRELMKPRTPPSPTFSHCYFASEAGELRFGKATRFVFSAVALEALRVNASGRAKKKCTRFQALVALLWTAQAKSLGAGGRGGSRQPGEEFPLRMPVNLRERVVPTLTRGYTGNATVQCIVRATMKELCERPLEYVAGKIGAALERCRTREYAQSEVDFIELQLMESASSGTLPHLDHSYLAMPSLVQLPFYDTDCGWGRPVYCGRPSNEPFQRLFILDHPAAGAWNVLNVFNCDEERAAFQEAIAEYISYDVSSGKD